MTRTSQNPDISDIGDLRRGARKLLNASGEQPIQVTVALNADAPLRMADLVCGNTLDPRLSFGWKALVERLTIDAVRCAVSGPDETITLDLLKGSDAEAA